MHAMPYVERVSDTGLIDLETILDRVGGDQELLREITGIFLAEYPALLADIQAAIEAGDAKRLERAAHSLKGSVANFGARAATDVSFQLEIMGRKGHLEHSPEAFAELLTRFRQLQPCLEALAA